MFHTVCYSRAIIYYSMGYYAKDTAKRNQGSLLRGDGIHVQNNTNN